MDEVDEVYTTEIVGEEEQVTVLAAVKVPYLGIAYLAEVADGDVELAFL